VATVDFVTPVVDDARLWGRIAAVNAASDVYAMGGRPLFALNVVGWNAAELPLAVLDEVLAGAAQAALDGGWVVVGGHTVDDPEPKFGQAVIGEVHPDRILTNAGVRAGQSLVLTKALGVGVVATAIKRAQAPAAVVDAAVVSMTRLNAEAAAAAMAAGATGATDVTGFGLLGHLRKVLEASGVDAEIDADAVPLLPGARELAAAGMVPGGTERNLAWVRPRLDSRDSDELTLTLLADAQTSGGLLFGAPAGAAAAAVDRLRESGHDAAIIGTVTEGAGRIRLR
jgi:selenide,water dikinase